jgi:hypothetical protein
MDASFMLAAAQQLPFQAPDWAKIQCLLRFLAVIAFPALFLAGIIPAIVLSPFAYVSAKAIFPGRRKEAREPAPRQGAQESDGQARLLSSLLLGPMGVTTQLSAAAILSAYIGILLAAGFCLFMSIVVFFTVGTC